MNETDPPGHPWQRRRLLAVIGAGVGTAALGTVPTGASAAPRPSRPSAATRTDWAAATTQNGWPVIDSARATGHRIEGSNATVALVPGPVAIVLLHVARRFHYEVDSVEAINGHRSDRRVTAAYESNYLSGSAIEILPGRFPIGARDGLFPHELATVRDILAECDGVVRWGGDHRTLPKEGHFQIDVRPGDGRLRRIAEKISSWTEKPGRGAGTPPDIFSGFRRAAATGLADRQRASA
ncbi:hypothetical protein AB0B83_17200 [Micromonospora sp. NPDC049060]|uniref:hypothetical protein n=1 Tax=Micromonospora sp. NPDC049060 TaxID=3154828 RepID=UPI0033C3F931